MNPRSISDWCCCLLIGCLGCGGASQPASPPAKASHAPQTERPSVAAESPSREPAPAADRSETKLAASRKAFDDLLGAMQDSNPDEWQKAEAALSELGADAVPVLAERLGDSNSFARELAAQILAQLGPSAADAEPQLVAALNDESSLVRMNAAAALLSMNSSASEIDPALETLLNDPEDSIRLAAAISLAGLEQTSAKAVAALTQLLSSESSVRLEAVEALGRLGDKAAASLSALRRIARDADSPLRSAALSAIERIESDATPGGETIPVSAEEP